ncbi:unnamed protein product [Peniophora sp. CBMAI 1063]|nr:unnamed protein product [Peniophora sp. CBMAI 1063]
MQSDQFPFDALALWGQDRLVLWNRRPFSLLPPEGLSEGSELHSLDPRPLDPELLEIDRQIASLEKTLADLRLRKEHWLGARSLVRRLPPEILQRTFELAVHESPGLLAQLSLVSRGWRSLVLATPVLWTYINLNLDDDSEPDAEVHSRLLRKLSTTLQRSGNCKLHIDLDAFSHGSRDAFREIMDLLTPHLARAYFFHVSVPNWDWMRDIAKHATALGPMLEHVHLGGIPPRMIGEQEEEPCVVITHDCPRLRYAVLENVPPRALRVSPLKLCVLHVILDQRRNTGVRPLVDINELLALTSGADELRRLRLQRLRFVLTRPVEVFKISRTRTHCIRMLSLHDVDSASIAVLLDSGNFPALVHLSVDVGFDVEGSHYWLAILGGAVVVVSLIMEPVQQGNSLLLDPG